MEDMDSTLQQGTLVYLNVYDLTDHVRSDDDCCLPPLCCCRPLRFRDLKFHVACHCCHCPLQNDWTYWCGVGVFHSGVEVYGVEYAFGGHEYDAPGGPLVSTAAA